MFTIVRKDEGTVRQIADNKSANNLIDKGISPNVSLATTEAADFHEKEIAKYNRIYYVLEGKLELGFDGEFHILETGDSCFIGEDTEYEMKGTFKIVTVNQPAFGT